MKIQTNKIKTVDADRVASSLLTAAAEAFENPTIQAEFEEWLERRRKEANPYGPH